MHNGAPYSGLSKAELDALELVLSRLKPHFADIRPGDPRGVVNIDQLLDVIRATPKDKLLRVDDAHAKRVAGAQRYALLISDPRYPAMMLANPGTTLEEVVAMCRAKDSHDAKASVRRGRLRRIRRFEDDEDDDG